METLPIPPAVQVQSPRTHVVPGRYTVTELFFQVPLDYANPSRGTITLFGRLINKREVSLFPPDEPPAVKPYLVYLQGGPGFGNGEPQDHPLTRFALPKGYQILYLDHRGVGLSTPVSARMLEKVAPGGLDAQAEYLRLMRQDNTVRDCEAVRKCLTEGWPEHKAAWSIFGQSYGGFVALSYLSLHPEGLREVFLTGGLAPVGRSITEVYEATFRKVVDRNRAYYAKFPEDVDAVRRIAAHIESEEDITLPSGGVLTVPRFLTLGISFGANGGFGSVHAAILGLKTSLDQFGFLTRAALASLESWTPFDNNIIYAILHEAIYCDGPGSASKWAAQRVGAAQKEFNWLSPDFTVAASEGPLFFSGEMIFPQHFGTHPELQALQLVAQNLADFDHWPALYDQDRLRDNQVPVYAASYVDDMYVDNDFARDTAKLVKGIKVFETNVLYHSALRAKSDQVLQQLFALRDDVLD